MELPVDFENRMRDLLKERYELFCNEFCNKPHRALRLNRLKCDEKTLKSILKFLDKPTAFCPDSYYIPEEFSKPGNHPLHHAGAYYIQEPSASSVVEAIGIEEGETVLDLCASPGGKSTQIASKLGGKGLLLSNEYVASRVGALVSNIERMGIPNAVVTNMHPDDLCPLFPGFFDKVVVDAPCSGEGMFRKDSGAIEDWSVANVKTCAERQYKILESAKVCVKNGGKMVYSTCTYSPEENEMTVARFLANNPDFRLIKPQYEFGEPAFVNISPETENIDFARRIFNFSGGEGHFVAVMQRDGESFSQKNSINIKNGNDSNVKCFNEFFKENFNGEVGGVVVSEREKVYIIPDFAEILNVKAVRKGIFAGVNKNGRFVPEHALFNTNAFTPKQIIDLDVDSEDIKKFLHGEEIDCDSNLKGYVGIRVCGVPLGFGKASSGRLKNHYPKGLRTL